MKRALYFGCVKRAGHFLWLGDWRSTLDPRDDVPGFPWELRHLDGGLLKNRGVSDAPDGRVHWTCGGSPIWIAFFWWDRSVDRRGGSNSGFYVQGFDPPAQLQEAMDFACGAWSDVAARQLFPLVLQREVRP